MDSCVSMKAKSTLPLCLTIVVMHKHSFVVVVASDVTIMLLTIHFKLNVPKNREVLRP